MRPFPILFALIPCAALAAQDAPAPPVEAAPAAAEAKAEEAATRAGAPVEGSTPTDAAPTTSTPTPTEATTPPTATATAEAAAEAVEPLPAPPPPPPAARPYPKLGVFLGAGLPQATSLSIIYRPVPLVRLHAGPSWDYLGFGLHGGVTLTPIRWAISPTIGAEVGRFASFDVTKVVKDADPQVASLMRNVSVTYAAALLGVEIGSQRGFAFDLKFGLAWLEIESKGTGTFTGSGGTVGTGGATNDATITVSNPIVRATAPTVQLGFQYFF